MSIVVLITTKNRTELLQKRSLSSVLKQSLSPNYIYVMDDSDQNHLAGNRAVVDKASKVHPGIQYHQLIGESGYASAINKGLSLICDEIGKENPWIAILDDDDCWYSEHLETCLMNGCSETTAVISGIQTIVDGKRIPFEKQSSFLINQFLSGNPGWEGSNTFCRLSSLLCVDGLREELACTHDRDLAIRLLNLPDFKISYTNKLTVEHYIESTRLQLTTSCLKMRGLQNFYRFHSWRMNEQDRSAFMDRSEQFFNCSQPDFRFEAFSLVKQSSHYQIMYNSSEVFSSRYVIGVALKNPGEALKVCLESFLSQVDFRDFSLLLLDDSSTNDWMNELKSYLLHPNLCLARCEFNSTSKTRNHLIELSQVFFDSLEWIGRLDSDDSLHSKHTLKSLRELLDSAGGYYSWAIGGNSLQQGGRKIERTNYADANLRDKKRLLERLQNMSDGIPAAELPSCNLWLRAKTSFRYPVFQSAEDHWLVTYLLCKHADEGVILGELLYCTYSLDGAETVQNKRDQQYYTTRKSLQKSAEFWLNHALFNDVILGWGNEGYVEKNSWFVNKVFTESLTERQWTAIDEFCRGACFPDIVSLRGGCDDTLSYRFEATNPADEVSIFQVAEFASVCMDMSVVCKNVKRSNLRLKEEKLIYIDVGTDIVPFSIAVFQDMVARFFLLYEKGLNDFQLQNMTIELRKTSGALSDLSGFEEYYAALMDLCVPRSTRSHPENFAIHKKEHPNVSLLIKACAQDCKLIETQLRHINRQILLDNRFFEVILLIDSRQTDFLREYAAPDLGQLVYVAKEFEREGLIDRILLSPTDEQTILNTYETWFGQSSIHTHTSGGVPLFSQLWAFNQVGTKYVVQMDIDCLIGRRDLEHDFIQDMLEAIYEEGVFSVGFNIPHPEEAEFQHYRAEPGQYVPEVRFGLLDLERIQQAQPLPNSLKEGKFLLAWYRALESRQVQDGARSLRGGSPRSYYIHPPNSYKVELSFLNRVCDLVEQDRIPELQFNRWDLLGTTYEWDYQRRWEDIIVFVSGRNTGIDKVKRCLESIHNQSFEDYGLIIVDDDSTDYQKHILNQFSIKERSKTTLVKRCDRHGKTINQFELIRKYVGSFESLVVILDLDDFFIHSRALEKLHFEWQTGADVIFGGMYRSDKPLKVYEVNTKNLLKPDAGNVWIHLRGFRKGLFHSVPKDFFFLGEEAIEYCNDFASMVPIVKMAKDIRVIDEYLLWHERSTPNNRIIRESKDKFIDHILSKACRFTGVDSPRRARYFVNYGRVELDITYACNLKCIGCNRSCTQAPSRLQMSMDQIVGFIEETKSRKIFWESVHVMGGEPTLHPNFLEIINLLESFFEKHSPGTERKVISNGYGRLTQSLLQRIPSHWLHEKSYKTAREVPWFEPFNDAPIDDPEYIKHDFSHACWMVEQCGIGYTPGGWYGCAVAGGIDRVAGKCQGFEGLPETPQKLQSRLNQFCKMCGHYKSDVYKDRKIRVVESNCSESISHSWKEVYGKGSGDGYR